jgi:hypothetical protein
VGKNKTKLPNFGIVPKCLTELAGKQSCPMGLQGWWVFIMGIIFEVCHRAAKANLENDGATDRLNGNCIGEPAPNFPTASWNLGISIIQSRRISVESNS